MGEPINPESAFAALEALLKRIVNDLGPEYGPRLSMTIKNIIQPNNIEDKEDDKAISNNENEVMEIESIDSEGDITSCSREEIVSEEEASETSSSSEDGSESPKPGQKRARKSRKAATMPKKQQTEPSSLEAKTVKTPPQLPTQQLITGYLTAKQPAPTAAVIKPTLTQPATQPSEPPTKSSTPNNTTTNSAKASGMPPIFCFSGNIAEISRFCKGRQLSVTFKNRNTKTTIISAGNRDSFEEVKKFLKERKIQYNSYTPREDRKNLLLLKGIHYSHEAIEVEDELRIEGLTVVKVTPFQAKKGPGKVYNNFVVELGKSCDISEVYTKTLIMNQRVHWERLKSNDLVQCRNCQRFGHVATNCGRQYVCVKCKEEHDPGKCQRKENTGSDVWCANCQKEGHPASFKGCPTLKAKLTERNKVLAEKKSQKEFVAKSACTVTRPAVSFANVVKGGTQSKPAASKNQQQKQPQPTRTPAKIISASPAPAKISRPTLASSAVNLSSEVQRIFGSNLMSVMEKARSAVPHNYGQLSEGEKSVALATFIFQLCN